MTTDKEISKIADEYLNIEDIINNDDFYLVSLSIESIREALKAAYNLGQSGTI